MDLARQTVLIVEDDPNDVLFLQLTFQRVGLVKPPYIVSSGETALAYLQGEGEYGDRRSYPLPGLIFLDLKLPGISGFEVLTWIRQRTRFHKVRIVVLTGSNLTIDNYRAYELGANAYLAKPVSLDGLTGLARTLKMKGLSAKEVRQTT